jgi:hypothetical protein
MLPVCLYVYPLILARRRFGKNVTAATNTHTTVEELFEGSFSLRPVLAKEGRRLVLARSSC